MVPIYHISESGDLVHTNTLVTKSYSIFTFGRILQENYI